MPRLASSNATRGLWAGLLLVWTVTALRANDWPQWLGPQRDGVWRETGILERFTQKGPKVRWRTPISMGYSGPAVAGGRVYITDRTLPRGGQNSNDPFGRSSIAGKERVLCLDEATGKILWTQEYDCTYEVSYPSGPRTTPIVHEGKVYTLGAMGDLFCLDAGKGKVLWSKNFPRDYAAKVPMWGFSSNPLLDGNKIICLVGGKGGVAAAFDKDTGKELWHALEASEPGYSPPVIYDVGGKRQLIIWHPEAVNSLDPETGKVYWSQKFRVKSGLTAPMPRLMGDLLLVTSFYNGSMMLKLDRDRPAASVLWKGRSNSEQPDKTDGLHSIIPTPFLKDGYIYGVCSYGELRCLKADTGERVWSTLRATGNRDEPDERWANAFLIAHGDRFFLPNEKGDLIIARLTPQGYEEISRAHILEPTNHMVKGRLVVWSHPAFADRCVFARNDREIVCVSLAANDQ
jgi:outer membrane protein assembly factor BamB